MKAVLEKSGGYGLWKKETHVEFLDFKTHHLYTLVYVLGLTSLILLLNGLAQGFIGNQMLGMALVAAGVLDGVVAYFVWKNIKTKESKPEEATQLGMIDFRDRSFISPESEQRYPLKDVTFAYTFAFFSSSKNLVARHPDGETLLARGNPLALSFSPFKGFFDELMKSAPSAKK